MHADFTQPKKPPRMPFKRMTLGDLIKNVITILQGIACTQNGKLSNASRSISWWSKDQDINPTLHRSNPLSTTLLPKGTGQYFVTCSDEGIDGHALRILMMNPASGQCSILMTIMYNLEPTKVWEIADTLQKSLNL